ncbi:hypothetical protein KTI61_14515 [Acinetobacter pittii]|uniref:hypothetical protein n=1 Tax=Acinetobacter pittii TaxID=48296 RepID=UPI0021CD9BE4|nr:hypothetical protein [Acinetobacter pittii]MCU4550196.1 hypothetical protein [Acinetobacter pittii]
MNSKNIKEEISSPTYIPLLHSQPKTMKEQNEEIKNNLTAEIQKTLIKLQKIMDGTAFNSKVLSDYSQLVKFNEPHLIKLIGIIKKLELIVDAIDVSEANLSYLDSIAFSLNYIDKDYDENNIKELPTDILDALSTINAIISYVDNYKRDSEIYNQIIISKIKAMLNEANEELEDLKKTKNILKNYKAEQFYNSECKKYTALHVRYKNYFVFLIIMAVLISIASVELVVLYKIDEYIYWSIKITIILAFITLITYYLKQSSYYQRLAEQANQTRLEIEAFPSFIAGVSKTEEVAIRKELALKYFGKEIDGAAHKDMSNLISDQMKNTTEMVKATTEAIKNLKGL